MQQASMPHLHQRVVGARLKSMGLSPYFTHWQPGQSATLYDETLNRPDSINGVAVTPTILWMHQAFDQLDYCSIKKIWWLAMEAGLFALFLMCCWVPVSLVRQFAAIATGGIFFCYSNNWLQHVYLGSYFVFPAIAMAATALFILRYRKRFSALFVYPLAALVRPFFWVATIPWLVRLNRKRRLALVVSVVLSAGILVTSAPLKTWGDYFEAAGQYAVGTGSTTTAQLQPPNATEPCVQSAGAPLVFKTGNLATFRKYMAAYGGHRANNLLICTLALLVAVVLLVWPARQMLVNQGSENLLLLSFVLYVLAGLFIPATRGPFQLIQYLGVLGVFIHKTSGRYFLLMLAGLMLNNFKELFVFQRETGEILILAAIYLSVFVKKPEYNIIK